MKQGSNEKIKGGGLHRKDGLFSAAIADTKA